MAILGIHWGGRGGVHCKEGTYIIIIIVSSGGWEVSMTTQMVQKDHACCHNSPG